MHMTKDRGWTDKETLEHILTINGISAAAGLTVGIGVGLLGTKGADYSEVSKIGYSYLWAQGVNIAAMISNNIRKTPQDNTKFLLNNLIDDPGTTFGLYLGFNIGNYLKNILW